MILTLKTNEHKTVRSLNTRIKVYVNLNRALTIAKDRIYLCLILNQREETRQGNR